MHWGGIKNWIGEISKLKLKMTKSITWLFFIVFISGIPSIILTTINNGHSVFGKLHGKFGLILIVLMLIHVIKRRKWYKGGKTDRYFTPHIDNSKCVNCNKCVKYCPANVLSARKQGIVVSSPELCFCCRKCIAVCSKDAIS